MKSRNMRIYIYALLLLTVMACQPETKTDNDGSVPIAPENRIETPRSTENGKVASPVAPNTDIRQVQALLKGYWVIEFWIDEDPAEKARMRGHWFKFDENGTFASGYWEEETAQGVWAVQKDGGRTLLTLDSNNDMEDMQFNMQGINDENDEMSWSGTQDYKMSENMCKVIKLTSLPTTKQFEVE